MSTPATPALIPVFTITADIAAPLDAGPGLGGRRVHFAITGGRIAGPRLNGVILPGGSDWALVRTDGLTQVQASYSVRADDGTLIWVRNDGLRHCAPDVLARLRAGDDVPPTEYLFRGAPRFDAPDGPHQWLREHLFIASLAPRGRSITIDVYQVG
jgi:hypothetical protein